MIGVAMDRYSLAYVRQIRRVTRRTLKEVAARATVPGFVEIALRLNPVDSDEIRYDRDAIFEAVQARRFLSPDVRGDIETAISTRCVSYNAWMLLTPAEHDLIAWVVTPLWGGRW